MRVWGIAAQNDSLFQYLTDKFKVINESDSVFHEDVNNLMILYYGYAYRDSYGHMPVTEIKINQLLQQGKTEDAFDLCEKTLEQAPASPHILILAANLAQKLGTKSSKELDSYYARFFTCLSAMHWLGNGSAEVPFIVVNVSDEYAFLYSILKIQGIESQELIHREDATGNKNFNRFMGWADAARQLLVMTNADNPRDAQQAVDLGAEGIGLCRTEHMFFAEDRIKAVREMICARTVEEREAALAKVEPFQQGDFEAMYRIMGERPMTIRYLDPPLHEFLPTKDEDISVRHYGSHAPLSELGILSKAKGG